MSFYIKNNQFASFHLNRANENNIIIVESITPELFYSGKKFEFFITNPLEIIDCINIINSDLFGYIIHSALSNPNLNNCLDLIHPSVYINKLDVIDNSSIDSKHVHRIKTLHINNFIDNYSDLTSYINLQSVYITQCKQINIKVNQDVKIYVDHLIYTNKPIEINSIIHNFIVRPTTFIKMFNNKNIYKFSIFDIEKSLSTQEDIENMANALNTSESEIHIKKIESFEFIEALKKTRDDVFINKIWFDCDPYIVFFLEFYLGKKLRNLLQEEKPSDIFNYIKIKNNKNIENIRYIPYIYRLIDEFNDYILF